MAEAAPAFQFYPKDFLTDGRQAAMSAEEAGIYIRLMCVNWVEGSLPGELDKLARIGGVSRKRMERAWVTLQACFQPDPKNPAYALVQPRLERERVKQQEFRRRQSDNGHKGGRPKKETHEKANGNPSLSSGLSQTKPNHEPKKSSSSSSSVKEKEHEPSLSETVQCGNDDVGNRARAFIEHYAEVYPTWRHGTPYRRQDVLDFPTACSLVSTWPDDRLRLMAELFLRTDHRFAEEGRRSIRQFAALAEWCDNRLREHGK